MFLTTEEIDTLKRKMVAEPKRLAKLFRVKSSKYDFITVPSAFQEEKEAEGWELDTALTKKVKLRKLKSPGAQFEDDVWCQLYKLGYTELNEGCDFHLRWGDEKSDAQQLDVVAVDDETIVVVECKAAASKGQTASFKMLVENYTNHKEQLMRSLKEVFGNKKIKFVFATRNYIFSENSVDIERLERAKFFIYNDNTYHYFDNLIKAYKGYVGYQFKGLLFNDEAISKDRYEIPALRGKMGNKTYYMFSIEPSILLKIGYVLHRSRARNLDAPTYQRMLVPSRLKGITKYINEGGYFPNSVIINFSGNTRNRIEFQANSKGPDSIACNGTLKIPDAYGIAFIIDGQHRLYGYAGSEYKETNTIPVVAFSGMDPGEQLQIFMDINQHQKAVSPSLKLDLEEDLYWESDRLDTRLKALRSSIIKDLARDSNSVLSGMISVGTDTSSLSFTSFANALLASKFIPKAKGNAFQSQDDLKYALYDALKQGDFNKVMKKARKEIYTLLKESYTLLFSEYPEVFHGELIVSNRGTVPFILLLDSLNKYLIDNELYKSSSPASERAEAMKPYLRVLFSKLRSIPEEEKAKLTVMQGKPVEKNWLGAFENKIHEDYSSYYPEELRLWVESHDENVQESGQKYGRRVEELVRKKVVEIMGEIYGSDWQIQLGKIKYDCIKRIDALRLKAKKEGQEEPELEIEDVITIKELYSIVSKNWNKKPEEENEGFRPFKTVFSLSGFPDEGKVKASWFVKVETLSSAWSLGEAKKQLTKNDVDFLESVYEALESQFSN